MRPASVVAALLLAALLAPAARADESLGIQLVREAQAKMAAGDTQGALDLLEQARTEWTGSPVVACTRGDALLAAGRIDEALSEYDRALSGPEAHHAHFNRAVAQDVAGEQQLNEAGVPADVAALPDGPQPEMLQALQAARPRLESARDDFLSALDLQDEPQARESVGALNRRLDALAKIEDELRKRAEQDKPKDDQKKDDKQDQKDQQKDQKDQKDPSQDQKDKQQQDPNGQPQDQKPQDQPPQDQQQPDQQDQQDQKPQDQQQQDQQDASSRDQQGQPQSARELSEEEVQRLLDKLARLEDEARERQKAREIASRRAVEKDW
ncbi:MAG TPA: tetratricopeptide repeat protein [Planctomycetota bacterium]|nr:tetratricopeptide repeat protein [Planctomycetota bacterium]